MRCHECGQNCSRAGTRNTAESEKCLAFLKGKGALSLLSGDEFKGLDTVEPVQQKLFEHKRHLNAQLL